jgi:hypothetical protein
MGALLRTVESFMLLHDIQLNASKTVHVRKAREPLQAPLTVGGATVGTTLERGEPFRHLGVMLSCLGSSRAQIAELLRDKVLTDKIVGYLYKAVFLPRICYKASGLSVGPGDAERIERPGGPC